MFCILNLATTHTQIHTYTHKHSRTHAHTHTPTHTHTLAHTYMHNIHTGGTPRHHLHGTRMSHIGDLRHVYTTYIPF